MKKLSTATGHSRSKVKHALKNLRRIQRARHKERKADVQAAAVSDANAAGGQMPGVRGVGSWNTVRPASGDAHGSESAQAQSSQPTTPVSKAAKPKAGGGARHPRLGEVQSAARRRSYVAAHVSRRSVSIAI
jgi:hypothetical protein